MHSEPARKSDVPEALASLAPPLRLVPPTTAAPPPGVPSGTLDPAADVIAPVAAVFSIRWIMAVTAIALMASAVLVLGFVSERNVREALTREIEARLLSQARNLSLAGADALLSNYPELTLHPLALEM